MPAVWHYDSRLIGSMDNKESRFPHQGLGQKSPRCGIVVLLRFSRQAIPDNPQDFGYERPFATRPSGALMRLESNGAPMPSPLSAGASRLSGPRVPIIENRRVSLGLLAGPLAARRFIRWGRTRASATSTPRKLRGLIVEADWGQL